MPEGKQVNRMIMRSLYTLMSMILGEELKN